jgi:hypothetical protein
MRDDQESRSMDAELYGALAGLDISIGRSFFAG